MSEGFVNTTGLPFCKGCGHHLAAQYTDKALRMIGMKSPLDVILVSDIGCVGIVDKQFNTHTVHGLHGRSIALAMGISLGLNDPAKKVLVFIGDGGITIGLQHLMEAAQKNVNMTVVLHNNMLYGMTGGQPSGLTPGNFKTAIEFENPPVKGYDLCKIVQTLGAPYARRILGSGDLSKPLAEAFAVKGFSLIELVELCPSHGVKRNPGKKIQDILESAGIEFVEYRNPEKPVMAVSTDKEKPSLLEKQEIIEKEFTSDLKDRCSIIIEGSAGEGVQTAAELFVKAAIKSGLHATKKGSYPVTVGIGFSAAEITVSRNPILYTGIGSPDAVIVVSEDGLNHRKQSIETMNHGALYIDKSLSTPKTDADVHETDFRNAISPKSAALFSMFHFLKHNPIFPLESLFSVLSESSLGTKVSADQILKAL